MGIRSFLTIFVLLLIFIGVTQATPLEISIEEKVNSTATPTVSNNGGVSYAYSTDVKGFVKITNNGSDPLYDVWVALKLENITGSCSFITLLISTRFK